MAQDLLKLSAWAQSQCSKGRWTQFAEILRLRCTGHGTRIGFSDYYKYRLFDDKRLAQHRTAHFVGWRQEQALDARLNAHSWQGIAADKLIQHAVLGGLGLPVPRLQAVHHPSGRYVGQAPCITDRNALRRFLQQDATYPLFCKPAHGAFGHGAAGLLGYEAATDSLCLLSEERLPLDTFIDTCHPRQGVFPWHSGFLFQDCLQPHPSMVALCGPRLCSVRMICLVADAGPVLLGAVAKILTGHNMADNFDHGSKGNLLAQIDLATGAVVRVVGGEGSTQTELTKHPDTGAPFAGWRIPGWADFTALMGRAATVFPALRLQHWDVAITDKGPVILEINAAGDLDLPQLAANCGFMDRGLQTLLADLASRYPAYR